MRFIAPPRVAFRRFLVASLAVCGMALVVSCGDDSSDKSPVQAAEESSSSEFERSSSSIQNVTPVSSEAIRSSSSICEDCDESSSSVTPQSSSSETSVSSSSAKSSSSSAKVEDSSSSAKVDESSSSMKAAESSSSVKVEESSSSEKNEVSSSSEKPVESSSSEKVEESSSSEKSSSSAGIPSKIYDCEIYKCVTTKYLNPDIEYGEYLDVRDSQVYRTVQIGEQVWMAQNLNYKSDMQSLCFDNDDNNCAKWGRLYTWAQAVKACPEGWKLPDSSEYGSLAIFLKDSTGNKNVGKYLKTGKNNLFGFSVLLGSGYFVGGPDYFNEGGETYGRAYFWTASETDEQNTLEPPDKYAIIRSLKYSNDIFGILPWEKQDGLSVRCLKNL